MPRDLKKQPYKVALATEANIIPWECDDKFFTDHLTKFGVEWSQPQWDDPNVDWTQFDLVIPRTTWDYCWKYDKFIEWCDKVGKESKLMNSLNIIKWNANKIYLRDLRDFGVAIAPTVFVEKGDKCNIVQIMAEKGWEKGFIKPMVGQTARETLKFDTSREMLKKAQEHIDNMTKTEGIMIQPFLNYVESIGEFSAVFFGNKLSHIIQKVPQRGDYRVMDDFGGRDRLAVLDQEGYDVCAKALQHPMLQPEPDRLLFGRVDLLRDNEGHWVLNEFELIEPSLFFRHKPDAGYDFAEVVMEVLTTGKPVPKFERQEISGHDSELWEAFLFWRFYLIIGGLVGGILFRLNMLGMLSDFPLCIIGMAFTSVMSAWAHYRASVDDQGKVLPHHFRDNDQIYYQQGKDSMAFHTYENQPEWIDKDLPISPYEECEHCHCIKINDYDNHLHVHHSFKSQACILSMDHHCTFTNRAVGKGNVKAFMLFLFYINWLTSIALYVFYYYVNKKDMWYFQNPKLNGAMMPSWANKEAFMFFPVRSDIDNKNWIDLVLFLGVMHFYTYTGSTLIRCFYQFKQGTSAVIWMKAYNDTKIWDSVTPRSSHEVLEFIFGQKYFSFFIFVPIFAPEKSIEQISQNWLNQQKKKK